MKEQVRKICTQLNDGQIAVTQATEQLLDLFSVSGSEQKQMYQECLEEFVPTKKWDDANLFLSTYGSGLAEALAKREERHYR